MSENNLVKVFELLNESKTERGSGIVELNFKQDSGLYFIQVKNEASDLILESAVHKDIICGLKDGTTFFWKETEKEFQLVFDNIKQSFNFYKNLLGVEGSEGNTIPQEERERMQKRVQVSERLDEAWVDKGSGFLTLTTESCSDSIKNFIMVTDETSDDCLLKQMIEPDISYLIIEKTKIYWKQNRQKLSLSFQKEDDLKWMLKKVYKIQEEFQKKRILKERCSQKMYESLPKTEIEQNKKFTRLEIKDLVLPRNRNGQSPISGEVSLIRSKFNFYYISAKCLGVEEIIREAEVRKNVEYLVLKGTTIFWSMDNFEWRLNFFDTDDCLSFYADIISIKDELPLESANKRLKTESNTQDTSMSSS